ncbi:replication protein VP4 [Gokushovirinae Bog8989_22]|uniref:replication protein VP4 n=1 Tax=Gokushovirinae Bog8989_22 TaxID=1655650 RepID=UPI00063D60D6|nr:replication protein VP4 [Gokushovirinae Bog8989_22]AKI26892.1 replication protein VP4 [Gokushovirinae Bog8989_22]
MHEADSYDYNCFITLTYSPEHLPKYGSLVKRDFQLFIKRLREWISDAPDLFLKSNHSNLRYYMCGEYGESSGRPHYHAILFNLQFVDRKYLKDCNGIPLYTSDTLSRIWGKGLVSIGSVTFDSAAYVARYILKKAHGEQALLKYQIADYFSGVIPEDSQGRPLTLVPEYTTMSRRPGIGKAFYDKYCQIIYRDDSVYFKDSPLPPPRYYDRLYELDHPSHFVSLRRQRVRKAIKYSVDNTRDRLSVKLELLKMRIKKLIRPLD